MAKTAAKGKHFGKRRTVRLGRPPRELAGEVDVRILDAARQLFLERGLAGASVDGVALRARAGKPTIYARFPSKEALFTAVMMRSVDVNIARFQSHVPTGTTVEARLVSVGTSVLHWVLASDAVDLMRLAIGEAHRFPDLASRVHLMVRERGTGGVARLLGEAAQSDEFGRLPAFAPGRLAMATRFFLDLVLLPLLLRALHGEKLKPLHTQIAPHTARSVRFFLAACRHGGVS